MGNVKRIILIGIGILIGVALVVFVLTNKVPVKVTFLYVESVEIWLSVMLLIAAAAGALLMMVYTIWLWMRLRREIRRLNKKIAHVQNELVSYRNQTLAEPELFNPEPDPDPTGE